VLVTLPKRIGGTPGNVVLRGIGPASLALRPQVKLVAGRLPRPGSLEMMAGAGIAKRFQGAVWVKPYAAGCELEDRRGLRCGENRGYSSEIWGDADQLMAAFRRPAYSSVIFHLRNSGAFESIKTRLEKTPASPSRSRGKRNTMPNRSEMMAKFLRSSA